jgi:hypothetical protein
MSLENSSHERVKCTNNNNIERELRETGSKDVTHAAEVHVKWLALV